MPGSSSLTVMQHLGWSAGLWKCAIAYNFRCRKFGLPAFIWLTKAYLRKHGMTVYMRVGTSDYVILKQIFVEDEYAPLRDLDQPRWIVDCGANVGFSSLYFAQLYPSANILAIEPDVNNAKVFMHNLSGYKDQVELIRSAIWSHPARLVINPAPVTMEAAISVREAREDENETFVATDISSILDRIEGHEIDLLKIDIEGAEGDLFREPDCHRWLPRVRNIAIELHTETCKTRFFSAMARYDFVMSQSGELTICKNIAPKQL
jgi:FkbM family methyltransferase